MGGALPPGPGLGVRLALVDAGALPDEALMGFVHDQYRQLAFQQGQVWAALAEVARRPPLNISADAAVTAERQLDLAAAEISAELRLSQFAAERELSFGLDLQELPRVAAALRAGDLDRVKAVVLLEALRDLSEAQRDAILDAVLPVAATVPVSDLKGRVQRLAIALDPAWAERRYRTALKHQKVVHYLAEDGTVTVAANGLPTDEALPAMQRLTNLARAAKRAGAAAKLDQLRVALFCGLLGSRFVAMTQTQIIAELVTQFPKPARPTEDLGAGEPTSAGTRAPSSDQPADEQSAPDDALDDDDLFDDNALDDDWPDDEPTDDDLAFDEVRDNGLPEGAQRAPEPIELRIRGPRSSRRRAHQLGKVECAVRPIRASILRSDQDPDPPPF